MFSWRGLEGSRALVQVLDAFVLATGERDFTPSQPRNVAFTNVVPMPFVRGIEMSAWFKSRALVT
jgi:hypothetical protein